MRRLSVFVLLLGLFLTAFNVIAPTKILNTQVVIQAQADEDGSDDSDPALADDEPCDTCGLSHNLRVKNSAKGTRLFGICNGFPYPSGVWAGPSCDPYYLGTLSPGQNSLTKYNVPDIDAIQITRGYELREDVVGVDPLISVCSTSTYFKKVTPYPPSTAKPLGDHYRSFYLKDKGGGGVDNC